MDWYITNKIITKHNDICANYVNKYVEYGVINIFFFRSRDNTSNTTTKKLNGNIYSKHKNLIKADEKFFWV